MPAFPADSLYAPPQPQNPRRHNRKQRRQIEASLRRFGFKGAIIVDKDTGVILAGNALWEAAGEIGVEEVPILRVSFATEADRRAFILTHNKLGDPPPSEERQRAGKTGALLILTLHPLAIEYHNRTQRTLWEEYALLQCAVQEVPPATCIGCPETFVWDPVWRVLAFDSFSDLPDQIRTGEINFARCKNCGFQMSSWLGYLCYDRGQQRLIFASSAEYDFDLVDRLFAETVAFGVSNGISLPGPDHVREAILVQDYRDILKWLVADEEVYRRHAAAAGQFWQRNAIADLGARAALALRDFRELSSVMLLGPELGREFLTHLVALLGAECDKYPETDSRYREAASLLHQLEPPLQAAAITGRDSGQLSRTFMHLPGAADASVRLPDDTVDAIVEAFDYEAARIEASAAPAGPAIAKLLEEAYSIAGVARLSGDEQTIALEDAPGIKHAVEVLLASDVETSLISYVARTQGDTKDLVRTLLAAASGSAAALAGIQRAAIDEVQTKTPEVATLGIDVATFFMEVARVSLRLDAFVYAISMIATTLDFDRHAALIRVALLSVARAIVLGQERRQTRALHPWTAIPMAVAWQGTACYLEADRPQASSLCSGQAMNFFRLGKREDGALRSRCDAMRTNSRFRVIEPVEIEALIEDIKAYAAEHEGERHYLEYDLVDLLYKRAAHQLLAVRYRVCIAPTDVPPSLTPSLPDRTFHLAWLRLINPDSRRADVPSHPSEVLLNVWLAGCREHQQSVAGPKAMESNDAPVAAIRTLNLPRAGLPPVVAALHVENCPWFDTALDAMRVAETLDDRRWAQAWLQLIELLDGLEQPAISRFFFQALRANPRWREASLPRGFTMSMLELEAALAEHRAAQIEHSKEIELLVQILFGMAGPGGFEEVLEREGSMPVSQGALRLGGIFEAIGNPNAALGCYALAARRVERSNEPMAASPFRPQDEFPLARPIVRMARVVATENAKNPSAQLAMLCVELAEAAKLKTQRLGVEKVGGSSAFHFDDPALTEILADLPLNVETLGQHCPPNSAILFYSLMHQSGNNPGFWLASLIVPGTPPGISSVTIPFNNIYLPQEALRELMEQSRASIAGLRLKAAAEKLDQSGRELEQALEHLGSVLLHPEWVEGLRARDIATLFVVPEAYLFEVPWAALRVAVGEERIALGALQVSGKPLAINILPSLGALAARTPPYAERVPTRAFTALTATTAPWRAELAPLVAFEPRVAAAVRDLATLPGLQGRQVTHERATVSDLLDALREAETMLFFGHAEMSNEGPALIAMDGLVGEREVRAAAEHAPFLTKRAILLACSGISSSGPTHGAAIPGVHMALVRGGVDCVIGSAAPLFAVAALKLLESLVPLLADRMRMDHALACARRKLMASEYMAHPLFWGHIACFGNGAKSLYGNEARDEA